MEAQEKPRTRRWRRRAALTAWRVSPNHADMEVEEEVRNSPPAAVSMSPTMARAEGSTFISPERAEETSEGGVSVHSSTCNRVLRESETEASLPFFAEVGLIGFMIATCLRTHCASKRLRRLEAFCNFFDCLPMCLSLPAAYRNSEFRCTNWGSSSDKFLAFNCSARIE